ncbi:MAG: C25 family cysteine peptidase, partial [Ferruginibacter sp.]
IGRGVDYLEAMINRTNTLLPVLNKVPTFGWPASDMLLVSEPGTTMPIVPIGRLSVINGGEIAGYLQKVKDYETAQRTPSPFVADKAWMKKFMHVIGGKDVSENETFKTYMDGYKRIAEDTLLGASVETFSKTSAGSVQQANSQRIEQLFSEGLGFIGYFGHSSANTFEFNLSNPELYNNGGKYPFFNVSGCSAGNFFNFDPSRASGVLSLSEKYILAPQRGSIGFLADTHFGIPPFLNFYNNNFYLNFTKNMYGNSVGNQVKEVLNSLGANNPNLDYYTRIHLEEIALHGDPAIKINYSEKPDFVVEDPMVLVSPNIISVADANFSLKVKMQNIGKAVGDSIFVSIKRKLPNDSIKVLFYGQIAAIRSIDSLQLIVPINPLIDKGLNQLIIELDKTNKVAELFETNNTVTKAFYIFEDELRPTYPYNFSILNSSNITYVANTANPLGENRQYQFEIDTTELFNSSFKRTITNNGIGGIVQFSPGNITYTDSTVYYWRVAMTPTNNQPIIWNSSSFIYLPNSTPGFNQSHYYQQKKSLYNNILLTGDRKFEYPKLARNLTIRTGLHPYVGFTRIDVNLDFEKLELYGCRLNSLQFYVFDTVTLKPWKNSPVVGGQGMYGSWGLCQNSATPGDPGRYFFEFPYDNPPGGINYRQRAMNFIDNVVPNGMYVAITNYGNSLNNTNFVNQWKNDTTSLGSGNSLYHKLKNIGFSKIDSFYRNVPFMFFYKKGSNTFTPVQEVGVSDTTALEQFVTLNSLIPEGTIESPTFGPATSWNELHWRGSSNDPTNTDTT